jgi:hypothetical protein
MTETNTIKNHPAYDIVREDPMVTKRGRAPGKLYNTLNQIMELTPGEWYRVAKFGSKAGASSVKTQIKSGKRSVPAGKFDFTARADDTENASYLYVRYVGE